MQRLPSHDKALLQKAYGPKAANRQKPKAPCDSIAAPSSALTGAQMFPTLFQVQ